MAGPLAPDWFEMLLLAPTLATLAVWALLLRGIRRHGWPLGPTTLRALVAVLPVAGPISVAAVVYLRMQPGSSAARI